nr:three prime repair exonuclease 2 [Helicoverpa armigera]XP_049696614.1 three prime repair exonuclease 2 [Helicoverpa armigera]
MGKIATYVFFDVATDGTFTIAELCMIAVKRKHIELREKEPRTQNKFKLCFWFRDYNEKYTRPESFKEVFYIDEKFNEDVCNSVNSFLSCLEKPVCIIAHDGFNLHFPLLKYRFSRFKCSLPDDLLCTDSIYAFYDLMALEDKQLSKSSRSKRNKPGVKLYKYLVRKTFYDEVPTESYELCDIYNRVINGDLTPDDTENHCKMIMQLAIEKSKEFVTWVEGNHCRLSEVPRF